MSKIAVIQSVYMNDKPEYLKLAIDSIINQTNSDFIYLIGVDGVIKEELQSILENIDDERVTIYYNEINKGLASILNELLEICEKAEVQYIARMDSDDISMKDRFEKQVSFLENNPEVDLVGGAINEIDENGHNRGKVIQYPCKPDDCKLFFSKRNSVAHPTVMFRRSFFKKTGWFYPTDYMRNEDTRLWHEGYKHGAIIANIPNVVLNFRMTNAMFTQRRNGKEFAKSQLKLRKLINKELKYGLIADIYAYAMFLLMISPSWLLRLAYRILR